ncbi:hypothetical protein JT358_03990 [Micrococcales bacterium 31B]|nr:hypothetical protein [Micrococcales bacterium 31B]
MNGAAAPLRPAVLTLVYGTALFGLPLLCTWILDLDNATSTVLGTVLYAVSALARAGVGVLLVRATERAYALPRSLTWLQRCLASAHVLLALTICVAVATGPLAIVVPFIIESQVLPWFYLLAGALCLVARRGATKRPALA